MVDDTKKTDETSPKKEADSAEQKKVVKVKNISDRRVNTSEGEIKAGKEGKATIAELRSLNKYLKKI